MGLDAAKSHAWRARGRPWRRACALLAAGAAGLAATVVPLTPAETDAEHSALSGWSVLVLDGRKLLVAKGRSEIRRYGADEAAGLPEQVGVVSDAWLFGAHVGAHRALSTICPAAARSESWKGWVPDEKLRVATLEGGTLSVVDYRGPEDDDGPPGPGWRLHRENQVEIPPAAEGESPARGPWDVYALLARLGPLARGEEPLRVRMLTKRGEVLGVVERAGETVFDERVERLDDEEHVRLQLPVVELTLKPAPEAADEEHLLDMRGPVRMWVDPVSGALVRIEGTHSGIDRRIKLTLDAFATRAPDRLSPPSLDAGAGAP